MTKRSQMRKRFGRRNFKPRWFRLTSQSLSYAKTRGKRTICDIPLTDIVQVERLSDEDSFKMQNVFQVSCANVASSSVCVVCNYFALQLRLLRVWLLWFPRPNDAREY